MQLFGVDDDCVVWYVCGYVWIGEMVVDQDVLYIWYYVVFVDVYEVVEIVEFVCDYFGEFCEGV